MKTALTINVLLLPLNFYLSSLLELPAEISWIILSEIRQNIFVWSWVFGDICEPPCPVSICSKSQKRFIAVNSSFMGSVNLSLYLMPKPCLSLSSKKITLNVGWMFSFSRSQIFWSFSIQLLCTLQIYQCKVQNLCVTYKMCMCVL